MRGWGAGICGAWRKRRLRALERRVTAHRATAPAVGELELEIIRVREAGHALRESPDYERHRLTTQTPAFFDKTVRRQVEGLERAAAALENEAEEFGEGD